MAIVVKHQINGGHAEVRVDGDLRVFWESPEADFTARNANFSLLAALPLAMVRGESLHMEGAVDRRLMENVQEVSNYWSQWESKRYHPILVTADEVIDEQVSPSNEFSVCLSGGIDSTYACLSTVLGTNVELRRKLSLGVFVQGFDYNLDDHEAYQKVLGSVHGIVDSLGIEVAPVKTNWKQDACLSAGARWGFMHTIGLAAVLHLFAGSHRGGILGSDYTYREDYIVAPWGSNSVINRMLSSTGFDFVPVGAAASRLQKIKAIQEWGKLPLINVCWAGPRTGSNCSQCEKCLRTMLMCEAQGIDPRPTFGRAPTAAEISKLKLSSPGKIAFVQQVIDAFDNPARAELRHAARLAIKRSKARKLTSRVLSKGLRAIGAR